MRFIRTGFIVILFATVCSSQSYAESLTFKITNDTVGWVGVEFYAQGSNRAWPGGDEMYTVGEVDLDWDSPTFAEPIVGIFHLNCNAGEKICMGAWDIEFESGDYWGVGRGDTDGCTGCCAICDGGVSEQTLSE